MNYKKCPTCNVTECFGCEEGRCLILMDNDFGERSCPFFKTREQVAEEKEYCRKRLDGIRKGE